MIPLGVGMTIRNKHLSAPFSSSVDIRFKCGLVINKRDFKPAGDLPENRIERWLKRIVLQDYLCLVPIAQGNNLLDIGYDPFMNIAIAALFFKHREIIPCQCMDIVIQQRLPFHFLLKERNGSLLIAYKPKCFTDPYIA